MVKKLERIMKGVANKRRIQMLDLIDKEPELSVFEISDKLKIGYKTTSEHLRRMVLSRLIVKRYQKNNVRHKLTDLGRKVLKFLRKLE